MWSSSRRFPFPSESSNERKREPNSLRGWRDLGNLAPANGLIRGEYGHIILASETRYREGGATMRFATSVGWNCELEKWWKGIA